VGSVVVIPYVDKKGDAREKAGRLRLAVIQNADEETIGSFLNKNVEPCSEIRSDGWRGYSKTSMKGYDHDKRIVGCPRFKLSWALPPTKNLCLSSNLGRRSQVPKHNEYNVQNLLKNILKTF